MEGIGDIWLIGGGISIGLTYGILFQRHRFCLVNAVGNAILIRDLRYLHTMLISIAVAMTGTMLLETTGLVEIGLSTYRLESISWAGTFLGGLVFGSGATIAGGSAIRIIVRAAQGSIGAFLTIMAFAFGASQTQFGYLEEARLFVTNATAFRFSGDSGLHTIVGLSPQWTTTVILAIALVILLSHWRRYSDFGLLAAACVIGLLVPAAWIITGNIAPDEFSVTRPSAISISGPLARWTYQLYTGAQPVTSLALYFLPAVFIGAMMSAIHSNTVRLQPIRSHEICSCVIGGALMGIGSIVAGGCNIGHGLSGAATLALGSLTTIVGMLSGIALVVHWWDHRSNPAAF